MTFWRAAGLTYVNYSSIAARCVRNALKPGADVGYQKCSVFYMKSVRWFYLLFIAILSQVNAEKRAIESIKFQKWEAGKPVGKKE